MGLLWTVFFSALKLDGHWINAAIMSRPRTLSVSGVNGGVGWPGLRASAWWLEGLSKDCISFWLTAILYYKKSVTLKHSCQVRILYTTLGFFFCKVVGKNPWSRVAFFWAYLKKYALLVREIWQATSFLYLCSPYSPMHWLTRCLLSVNSQPVQ